MLKLVSFLFLILLPAYSYAESKVFTDSDLESYTRPETEQDRLNHQKRLEEIRQSEKDRKQTEEREKEIGEKRFLFDCLTSADAHYRSAWDEHCRRGGFIPNWSIPSDAALILDRRLESEKSECYRLMDLKMKNK